MNEEITIKKKEVKTSKGNKQFLAITTDKGRFSCWNPAIFSKLNENSKFLVTIEEKNGFKNILGIEKELGPAFVEAKELVRDQDKLISILVSYAKDLVVSGKAETMDGASQAILFAYEKIKGGLNGNGERPENTD